MSINVSGRALAPMVLALGLAVMTVSASAAIVVYDFDGLAFPGDPNNPLTTQIAGLTFTNTNIYKAGINLTEDEYPPKSGDMVVAGDNGEITIIFSTPVFSVSGYFTYDDRLLMRAYDSANVLLDTVRGNYESNLRLSGDAGSAPNDFLTYVSTSGPIARVAIAGRSAASIFVLDDLTIDTGNTVPEPQTLLLALALLGAGCLPRGWMRRRSPASDPGPRRVG